MRLPHEHTPRTRVLFFRTHCRRKIHNDAEKKSENEITKVLLYGTTVPSIQQFVVPTTKPRVFVSIGIGSIVLLLLCRLELDPFILLSLLLGLLFLFLFFLLLLPIRVSQFFRLQPAVFFRFSSCVNHELLSFLALLFPFL